MPGSPDDERDSRTAAVGVSRSQSNSSASASRTRHKTRAMRKELKDRKNNAKQNTQDLTPRGGTFAATPLDLDQDHATSSSGSQSSDSEYETANGTSKPTQNKGPAINWNQAKRSTIRTTLGKRNTASVPVQDKSSFDAVNDKYFRSRSASESEDDAQESHSPNNSNGHQDEDDQSKTYFVYDSEGSESGEVSEGGDSVMLNIGPQDVENHPLGDSKAGELANGSALAKDGGHTPKDSLSSRSKAAALAEFASKYKVAPAVLADLKHMDLQIQARYFFIGRNINDIDLSMPISCTECLEKGHLALVCPSKEVCCTVLLSRVKCLHYCSVKIAVRGICTKIGFVQP